MELELDEYLKDNPCSPDEVILVRRKVCHHTSKFDFEPGKVYEALIDGDWVNILESLLGEGLFHIANFYYVGKGAEITNNSMLDTLW